MRRDEFNASVRSCISLYENFGIHKSTVYQVMLPRSEDFNKTALTSQDYVEIYEKGLSLSQYNFLTTDLAFFQFSYSSDFEYSLAYYPNPRLSGSPDAIANFEDLEKSLDSGEITDEEFADLASCIPARGYIPRIRFEQSDRQYKNVRHPAAHFHIGMSGEDRWCSRKMLSPRSFSLLIAKLYYPGILGGNCRFSLAPEDQALAIDDCIDEQLLKSIRTDGLSRNFSAFEEMTFHFSALQGPA